MTATLTITVPPPPPVPAHYGDARFLVQEARISYPSSKEFAPDALDSAVKAWLAMGTGRADLMLVCELVADVDDAPGQLTARWNPERTCWTAWKDHAGGVYERAYRVHGDPVA